MELTSLSEELAKVQCKCICARMICLFSGNRGAVQLQDHVLPPLEAAILPDRLLLLRQHHRPPLPLAAPGRPGGGAARPSIHRVLQPCHRARATGSSGVALFHGAPLQ